MLIRTRIVCAAAGLAMVASAFAIVVATPPTASARAADAGTPVASRSTTTLGRGENSAISPDGRTVVYQAGHVMGKRNPETSTGRLMMWQDGKVRALLEARTGERANAPFSALLVANRGRYVVFSSWATTLVKKQLKPWPRCYVWTRKTERVKLLANGRPCFPTSLTADGDLYYEATSPGSGYRLRVVDITASTQGRLVDLPDGGYTGSLKISLDGRWYVYSKNGALSTADMASRSEASIALFDANVSAFELSPSGRFVAYIENRVIELPDGDEYQEPILRLWDRTTGVSAEVAHATRDEGLGVVGVSDTGRVAYSHSREDSSTVVQIRVQEAAGGPVVVLAEGTDPVHYGPPYGYVGPVTNAAVTRVLIEQESTRKHFAGSSPDGLSGWSESTNPKIRILTVQ